MNTYRTVTRRLNFFEKLIFSTYPELFLAWLLVNVVFTAAYFTLGISWPEHAPSFPPGAGLGEIAYDSVYFAIVTATTIGYGDIVPLGFSKVLAMLQSILALLVFTVLVGKLVSQRQDVTLREVHRMTFEGIFYHIRNVLYIARKDFDDVMHKARKQKTLDEHDLDNLATAYLQAHMLIEEIPELYDHHGYDLRSIDVSRERLLFEALHRTLQRIHAMLKTLNDVGIAWKEHAASERELRQLLNSIEGIMPLWKERTPFHQEKEFEDIRLLAMELHADMKETVG